MPPPSLFLPIIREDDVQLAPKVRVDVETAHAWTRGEQPLNPDDGRFYRFQTFARRATLDDIARAGMRVVIEPKNEEER